jgi:UDP-N-acetylmuramoylalanine--D-glutamate ligase
MIVVVGMARSGLAAARLLKEQGESVFVSDAGNPNNVSALEELGVPFETGGHNIAKFLEADEIVVSPGVPLDIEPLEAARQKGISIIGELELASRHIQGDVVAITGSNGKTTTTTLTGEILKTTGRPLQVGGNIGTPMCDLVKTSESSSLNVIEVSSFQLDTIRSFRPRVAAILNITPDHLDRYRSFAEYRSSKFRIFKNQKSGDHAVLNKDDAQCVPPPVRIRSRHLWFSRKTSVAEGAYREGSKLYLNREVVMEVADVPLRGDHNIENVLAAMAIASCYKVPHTEIARIVMAFRGVEHRIEHVLNVRGVEFYNDSKATNVDSAIKAVESFAGNLIMILGGKDKGASYAPLVAAMQNRVLHVVLIGAASAKIAEAIAGSFPLTHAASMQDAVEKAFSRGKSGDTVLLSPACASFDMFDNYEHRGKVFKQAVQELSLKCRNQ